MRATLLFCACFQATPADGLLACGAAPHECPPGYSCSEVGTCWKNGHTPKLQLSLIAGKLGGAGAADGVGAEARFDVPLGLSRAADGTMYLSDNGNHTLRTVAPDGTVTTLAGLALYSGSQDGTPDVARFNLPAGQLLVDDTLYVAEHNGLRVVKLPSGEVRTLPLGFSPSGIALEDGSLWVTDPDGGRIVQVNPGSGLPGTFWWSGPIKSPRGIVSDGAGNIYVADRGSNMVYKLKVSDFTVPPEYYGSGSAGTADGNYFSAQLSGPQGLVLDGKGHVFVADTFNCTIRQIDLGAKTISTLAGTRGKCGGRDGPPNLGQLDEPIGIVYDGNDSLFVADHDAHTLRTVSLSSGVISTFAGAAPASGQSDGAESRFQGPAGIVADEHGHLFVADQGNHTVREVELDGGRATTLAGLAGDAAESDGIGDSRFNDPRGLVYDGAGHLYVADGSGHAVRKIVIATGEVTTVTAALVNPAGLALDGQGHLFVADLNDPSVRRIDLATGELTTPWGTSGMAGTRDGVGNAAGFRAPFGLAYWDGALYVSDIDDHLIRQIDLETGYVGHFAGEQGVPGADDGVAVGTFCRPGFLVADGRGNLLVADNGNFAVRKIAISRGRANAISTFAGVLHRGIVEPGPLPASLNTGLALTLLPSGGLAVSVASENSLLMIR